MSAFAVNVNATAAAGTANARHSGALPFRDTVRCSFLRRRGLSSPLAAASAAASARTLTLSLATAAQREAKEALLERIKTLDLGRRGFSAQQHKDVDENYIKPVELANPTDYPVESPLLDGRWKLVYTNSKNILALDRPAFARPDGDSVYQTVNVSDGTVVNSERVFNLVENKVRARFQTAPPRRVNVDFKQFQFGFVRVPAPRRAQGWLDVTYLDEDMRISRGNRNSVFVLVKDGGTGGA